MSRVAIFLDANNFRQRVNQHFGKERGVFDVVKLMNLLANDRTVVKAFYYINKFKINPADVQRQERFFATIEAKLPYLKVKAFEMQKRIGADGYQEKGVDNEIVIDMIMECDCYDIAILVSEDKDFVGCVERLQNDKGKIIEVVVPIYSGGHHLRQAARQQRILTVREMETILMPPRR